MKWLFFLIPVSFFLACNDSGSSASPFDEILNQPPFASLTDSIRKDPRRDELYFRRAILLNKNNLPEPALADFRKAWSLNKEESYAIGAGNTLLEKQADSAILFLQDAVKELPQSIFLHLLLARAFDAANKTDDALAVCRNILERDSVQVNTLVLKAELLEKKKDTAGVISSLEKAWQIVPGNLEISNKLIYHYAESRNPKAISMADSLIKRDTLHLHPEPYYVKGVYYSNTNDKTNAVRLFDETIQRDHRFLNAYIEKGKILLEQKKVNEALKTFQLANTISPAFPDAWYWMGQCQEALGQKDEAKLNYEKAFALDKTFTEAKEAADKL